MFINVVTKILFTFIRASISLEYICNGNVNSKKGKGRNKKKTACVKEKEEAAFPDLSLHPVSRLAQIQQAAKGTDYFYPYSLYQID